VVNSERFFHAKAQSKAAKAQKEIDFLLCVFAALLCAFA
jgi:hypothetical protein